jgi:hypothetical protein
MGVAQSGDGAVSVSVAALQRPTLCQVRTGTSKGWDIFHLTFFLKIRKILIKMRY